MFTTHRWVIEELTLALAKNKSVFEIREIGVDGQGGIMGDRQRFEFDDKIKVMLEIAKFISKEKSKLTHKTIIFMPPLFAKAIKPHFRSLDTKCTYRFLHKGREYEEEETKLEKLGDKRYGIIVRKIPSEEAQIEITINGPENLCWSSGFFSIGIINVKLDKES